MRRRADQGSEEKEQKAWRIMETLLIEFKKLCAEYETPLLVVLIPDQVEVETDKKVYGLPEQFSDLKPKLEKFLGENEIDYYSPLPGLKEHYEEHQNPLYFKMNRHMTPEGNLVLAEILEPVLWERLAIKKTGDQMAP